MSLQKIHEIIERYSKNPAKKRKHARKLARLHRKRNLLIACLFALSSFMPGTAHALPTGGNVVAGQAQISQQGNTMTVNQSTNRAVINWNSFSIAQKEAFIHNMPSAQAAALHRVIGSGSSELAGLLKSNANIFLVNPNGITIHQGAQIQAGGFVATTQDIKDADFMAGRYVFDQEGKEGAKVINKGTISVADAGYAVLVAPTVRNEGLIAGKLAKVVLASGESFVLDLYGDDLIRFAVDDKAVDNLYTVKGEQVGVENTGTIKAEGGVVVMTTAQLDNIVSNSVNNSGLVSASSATMKGGKIVFSAAGNIDQQGTVTASSASGDGGSVSMIAENQATISGKVEATGRNAGGRIDITATEKVSVEKATINAQGAKEGLIRIGGEFQGGQNLGGVTAEQREGFEGRFDDAPSLASTKELVVDKDSSINAGSEGTIVAWSDGQTLVDGSWLAKYLETSGKYLGVDEDIQAVAKGLWLLDPDNLKIEASGGASASVGDANAAVGDTSINASIIENALRNGDVSLWATNTLTVNSAINWRILYKNNTLTLRAKDIVINQSVGSDFSFVDLQADNSLEINNSASVYTNTWFMNYAVGLRDTSNLFITQPGVGSRLEIDGLFNMEKGTTLNLLSPDDDIFEILARENFEMLVNGTIRAWKDPEMRPTDNVTIQFSSAISNLANKAITLNGQSALKSGHAIQAGKVVTDSNINLLLNPYSIYANEIDLQGSVRGYDNSETTPGISLNAKSPTTPLVFTPGGVVIDYLLDPEPTPDPNPNPNPEPDPNNQNTNQNQKNEEEQKIDNAVNALDKQINTEGLSNLQKLMVTLPPDLWDMLMDLPAYELQKLLNLLGLGFDPFNMPEDLLRLLLNLPSNLWQYLLSLNLSAAELELLLSLSLEDLLYVLDWGLSSEQLKALLSLPAEEFNKIASIGLTNDQIRSYLALSLTDTQRQLLLSLSAESILSIINWGLTPDQLKTLLSLSSEELNKIATLGLTNEQISSYLALPLTDAQRSFIFGLPKENLKNLLAMGLTYDQLLLVLNLPTEDFNSITEWGLSTTEMFTYLSLAPGGREYIRGLQLDSSHKKKLLALSAEERAFLLGLPLTNADELAVLGKILDRSPEDIRNIMLFMQEPGYTAELLNMLLALPVDKAGAALEVLFGLTQYKLQLLTPATLQGMANMPPLQRALLIGFVNKYRLTPTALQALATANLDEFAFDAALRLLVDLKDYYIARLEISAEDLAWLVSAGALSLEEKLNLLRLPKNSQDHIFDNFKNANPNTLSKSVNDAYRAFITQEDISIQLENDVDVSKLGYDRNNVERVFHWIGGRYKLPEDDRPAADISGWTRVQHNMEEYLSFPVNSSRDLEKAANEFHYYKYPTPSFETLRAYNNFKALLDSLNVDYMYTQHYVFQYGFYKSEEYFNEHYRRTVEYPNVSFVMKAMTLSRMYLSEVPHTKESNDLFVESMDIIFKSEYKNFDPPHGQSRRDVYLLVLGAGLNYEGVKKFDPNDYNLVGN